jgi:hypothetical protein
MTPRPLDGIRVLELAQIVAGPFCGALLAEFGADVIKTAMPGKGDDLRRLGPAEGDVSYWWAIDNRNKGVMTLDLRTPGGAKAASMSIAGELARFVTGTRVDDLPPLALERARMAIASAAMGADIVSSRLIRELSRERGGSRKRPGGHAASAITMPGGPDRVRRP